jgi:hypothetical protein
MANNAIGMAYRILLANIIEKIKALKIKYLIQYALSKINSRKCMFWLYPERILNIMKNTLHRINIDTVVAWENLALEALSRGLSVHGMQGFDYERARN